MLRGAGRIHGCAAGACVAAIRVFRSRIGNCAMQKPVRRRYAFSCRGRGKLRSCTMDVQRMERGRVFSPAAQKVRIGGVGNAVRCGVGLRKGGVKHSGNVLYARAARRVGRPDAAMVGQASAADGRVLSRALHRALRRRRGGPAFFRGQPCRCCGTCCAITAAP